MKKTYLVLAVIGAIIPYYFFIQHFAVAGYGLPDFLAGVFATPAASGFTADLLITSLVFWIFMFTESGRNKKPWLFIALNLLIGLSCALPAYLYSRERAQENSRSQM